MKTSRAEGIGDDLEGLEQCPPCGHRPLAFQLDVFGLKSEGGSNQL